MHLRPISDIVHRNSLPSEQEDDERPQTLPEYVSYPDNGKYFVAFATGLTSRTANRLIPFFPDLNCRRASSSWERNGSPI
jgi:hypothetical protein